MVFTLEEYQQLSATQRKNVKRAAELQALLDEHVNDDVNVNSLWGVIREEHDNTFGELETTISKKYDAEKLKNFKVFVQVDNKI